MYLDIKSKLDAMDKTQYWLSKQTGISVNHVMKMYNGETNSIRFETLDKLCTIFQCTPNDLLIR